MKVQIRRGLFETNSSSTHTITMCTDSEWNDWKEGKLIFNRYNEKLVPISDDIDLGDSTYLSYTDFLNYDYLEPFEEELNGIHAFGLFGYE